MSGIRALALALASGSAIGVTTAAPAVGQVRYVVTPVRADSLVHLRVETTFRGEIDGETRFSLPSDRFGVSEMHSWIRDLRAGAGAALAAVEPGVHRVTHGPGAKVAVAYTVAYDPRADGFVAFGPDVGPDHFHFFGSQWMARVGPGEGPRDVEVLFRVEGWDGALGSSFGLGPGPHRLRASDYDLDYSVIAGGRYRADGRACQGRPVLTLVHGDFDLPDERIFPLVERIVCGQREMLEDHDRPFFTVFITERDRLEAGAPVRNGFTTFLEPGVEYEELRDLLAHEMTHTWLPWTARLVEADRPDAPEARTRWFHEGFTEYLSRLLLARQGLVPRSWMVERTNEDIERLAYHPYRVLTLDELEAAVRENRYDSFHHRLHYLRGTLLALGWDARIRRASGGERSLLDAIRRVLRSAEASDGTVSVDELVEILEVFGVDAGYDLDRHLRGGEPIGVEEDAFAPRYELGTRRVPSFEPGYDVLASLRAGAIAGLDPDGPAARAGLREGMEVAATDNAVPWLGRWDPEEPTVVVVEADGERRRFSFPARGPEMEIPAYVPASGARDRSVGTGPTGHPGASSAPSFPGSASRRRMAGTFQLSGAISMTHR